MAIEWSGFTWVQDTLCNGKRLVVHSWRTVAPKRYTLIPESMDGVVPCRSDLLLMATYSAPSTLFSLLPPTTHSTRPPDRTSARRTSPSRKSNSFPIGLANSWPVGLPNRHSNGVRISACPQCQRVCRVTRHRRELITVDGRLTYSEPASHCETCRCDFFSGTCEPETR